jgi:hypothetical protein
LRASQRNARTRKRASKKTRANANPEVTLRIPMIAFVAATTFFAASLSNADAAPRRGNHAGDHHVHGHSAYASAARPAEILPEGPDGARASALRECCKTAANMYEQTWGVQQSLEYRACMASHGQME